jgi:hypothetical protein
MANRIIFVGIFFHSVGGSLNRVTKGTEGKRLKTGIFFHGPVFLSFV